MSTVESLGITEDEATPNPRDPARAFERRAPRSAGVAGIIFSVLFLGFALLVGARPPAGVSEAGLVAWFEQSAKAPVTLGALYVAPFAGIAFLWFLAVVRDRIGVREDRFFATVFLGSGLIFVAMFWAAAAAVASLVVGNDFEGAPPLDAGTLETLRALAYSFVFVLSARAAAVFMIVTSTIALRTATLPRWLIISGYVIALVMLLSVSLLQWIMLLFPVWVFVMSVAILNSEIRAVRGQRAGVPDQAL